MRGIIFTESNFHLTVQGIKTMTRRIIKPQPDNIRSINKNYCEAPDYDISEKPWTPEPAYHFLMSENKFIKPRYKVGETVYLKEPYFTLKEDGVMNIVYKYSNDQAELWEGTDDFRWDNKLYMPERYARYFIKITSVRVERLQDISEEDCFKEGIMPSESNFNGIPYFYGIKVNGNFDEDLRYDTPWGAYAAIIDKINGKGTWNKNPFVSVYDYELLTE